MNVISIIKKINKSECICEFGFISNNKKCQYGFKKQTCREEKIICAESYIRIIYAGKILREILVYVFVSGIRIPRLVNTPKISHTQKNLLVI